MKSILFSILFIFPIILFANGGPVDEENLYSFGILSPLVEKNITLEKELLNIKIEGDYSNVTVIYTLQNHDKAKTVQYGFPVDWDITETGEVSDNVLKGLNFDGQNSDAIIPSFAIYDGTQKLSVKEKAAGTSIHEKAKPEIIHEDYLTLQRKWFITDLSFAANEKKEIMVSYYVRNNFKDWGISKSCFTRFSSRMLLYDFTPAGNWGNGVIGNLQIIVDASEVFRNYGTCEITGLPGIINRNGKFFFNQNNADLKTFSSMMIRYDNSIQNKSKEIITHLINSSLEYSVKTSSELPVSDTLRYRHNITYSSENLSDKNFNTAWVEGNEGKSIGEYIEISFNKNFMVYCLSLINGYTKNKESYYDHNRIKELRVECFSFDGNIDSAKSKTITLKDLPYAEINQTNFAKMLSVIYDIGNGVLNMQKIRLTIKDVYPGQKFNNTCISELFVWGDYSEQ